MEERLGETTCSAPAAEPAGAAFAHAPSPGPDASRPAPGDPLLDRVFGRDEIAVVRHEISARLITAGLAGDRLHGFVLAVNEVITNVVLHAGGQGRVLLRLTGGWAWCTVTDSGPGLPSKYLAMPAIPEAFEVGGRGVWLAHQLCDELTVATGPIGTTIGLGIALPRT